MVNRWTVRATACLLAVALVSVATANPAQAEEITLRHRGSKGDKAVYDFGLSVHARVEEKDGSGPTQVEMTLQMKCLSEVLEVLPGGGQRVRAEITSGTMKLKTEGGEQAVVVGNVVATFQVSPLGEIEEYVRIGGDPPVLFFPGIYIRLGPEDGSLIGGLAGLPDRPLKTGDKWQGIAKKPDPRTGEAQEERYESRLMGEEEFRGRRCVKIRTVRNWELDGDFPTPDGSVVAHVKGRISGYDMWRFDPERGVIMSSDGSHHLAVTARARRDTEVLGVATTSATISTSSQLTEFNGQKVTED